MFILDSPRRQALEAEGMALDRHRGSEVVVLEGGMRGFFPYKRLLKLRFLLQEAFEAEMGSGHPNLKPSPIHGGHTNLMARRS